MPERSFKLEIVTPERMALKRDAVSLVVPGIEGSLGILADHAPLLVELTIGEVTVRGTEGKTTRLAIGGGFMEVKDNVVRILADTAEIAGEIDIARAEAAKARAEARLREKVAEIDHTRAEASLRRALIRLRVARGE